MKKLLAAAVAAAMTMTATFAMADGAIKIGEIGPLTGAAAIYGTAVANGAQIAIDELNAFDYEAYKANGFKLEHLGDYPLELDRKSVV